MKKVFLFLSIFFAISFVKAEGLTQYAKSAILIEPVTNTIIYEVEKDERRAPASMTKLMTMLLIMEAVDDGRISLEDMVPISETAAKMGGSQVFLQSGMEIKVSELLKSIAIASGNDAAVAMAEFVHGTLEDFVTAMNDKVQELGLANTHFMNVHGLDTENHYSSAYDMSQIARELLKHPKILEYTSLYEEYLNKPDGTKTWLVNTNKLVRYYKGVDGLKTGFTSTAGYCLTATALKNNIRFLNVVMGVDTSEHRSSDTTSLLNYGFNTYKLNTILSSKDVIDIVPVLKGKKEKVSVVPVEEVADLIKQNEKKEYSHSISMSSIKAPVLKGDVVGTLTVTDNNGKVIKEVSLTVEEDVEKQTLSSVFYKLFKMIISGF